MKNHDDRGWRNHPAKKVTFVPGKRERSSRKNSHRTKESGTTLGHDGPAVSPSLTKERWYDENFCWNRYRQNVCSAHDMAKMTGWQEPRQRLFRHPLTRAAKPPIQECQRDAFRRWSFLFENNSQGSDFQNHISRWYHNHFIHGEEEAPPPSPSPVDSSSSVKDREKKSIPFSLRSIVFVILATIAVQRLYKVTVANRDPVVTRLVVDPKVLFRGHLLLLVLPTFMKMVCAWLTSCFGGMACWIVAPVVLVMGVKRLCVGCTGRRASASCKNVQVGNWKDEELLDGAATRSILRANGDGERKDKKLETGGVNELPQLRPKSAAKYFTLAEEPLELRMRINSSK